MSLSDCIKCWNTPCTCGYEYQNYGVQNLSETIFNMINYYTSEQKLQIIKEVEKKIKEIKE